MTLVKKLAAEGIGTFWLVFGGCGAAILSATVPRVGIGYLGVAFAFGLTVLTMAYAFGRVSGAHFNPAVSVGLWAARRFPASLLLPYIAAQLLGAILASAVLYLVASGAAGFTPSAGFAANGYGAHSPGGYNLGAGFVVELVTTMAFVLVVLGATDRRGPAMHAPLAIGLCLTAVHLVSIPVTNASVNPARSTGPALFAGGWALAQLWLFWLAPLLAAVAAGMLYRALFQPDAVETPAEAPRPVLRPAAGH
jgi:aquaporin Z